MILQVALGTGACVCVRVRACVCVCVVVVEAEKRQMNFVSSDVDVELITRPHTLSYFAFFVTLVLLLFALIVLWFEY